jgi:putative hydrolase of HD superfamily
MNEENLLKLMFELGILSRTPRSGPYHVGITDHETSAAHSFRTSALAYFIAKEEGADENRVLKMCLIHDFPETRLLNQTFIQKEFYSVDNRTKDVLSKQLRNLKGSDELIELFEEFSKGESKEAKIVKDANTLEALVEAKEYIPKPRRSYLISLRKKQSNGGSKDYLFFRKTAYQKLYKPWFACY